MPFPRGVNLIMHIPFTITQPILYTMLAQRSALRLELAGMKHSRGSVYAHIKRTYNIRGNKQSVYTQFCELCEHAKAMYLTSDTTDQEQSNEKL